MGRPLRLTDVPERRAKQRGGSAQYDSPAFAPAIATAATFQSASSSKLHEFLDRGFGSVPRYQAHQSPIRFVMPDCRIMRLSVVKRNERT